AIGVPVAVHSDASGNVYIVPGHKVRRITAAGIISTVAGTDVPGFAGDGGPATSALLNHPFDVAADSSGIYIADFGNLRVRRVRLDGVIETAAGNGNFRFSGDGGPATSASLNEPTTLAFDATGGFCIFDSSNYRIRYVNSSGIITTIAGNGRRRRGALNLGDGGPATSASLVALLGGVSSGMVLDPGGNLIFADDERVRRISPSGIITTVAGGGLPGVVGDGGPATAADLRATGIALDSAGNTYVSDRAYHRVRKVSPSGTITTVAGNGTPGFSGDGGPATAASLDEPGSLASDRTGNLYVVDRRNSRVRKISPSGTITTVAANIRAVALAVDGVGNILIAESADSRVRRLSPEGTITRIAGGDVYGDGWPSTSATLSNPQGVAVDSVGNIYVSETQNYAYLSGSRRLRRRICGSPFGFPRTGSTDFGRFGRPV
ncbi:MAG: hypothetical protein ACREUU_05380, partial [Gammaproteobacteria bacterium]